MPEKTPAERGAQTGEGAGDEHRRKWQSGNREGRASNRKTGTWQFLLG